MTSVVLGIEAMKIFNKAIDLFAASASEIKVLNSDFLKFCSEEQRREKERNKAPKVHFERECPFPENPPNKKSSQTKPTQASENANKNDPNQPVKKPPQYLSYGGAAMAKPVQKPMISKPTFQHNAPIEKAEKELPKQVIKKDTKPPVAREDSAQHISTNNDLKKSTVAPIRPKNPISAFIRFNKAHIDDVRKEYPHMAQTDLVTVTGHMWNSLPAEVKKKFDEEYQRDKERFEAELAEFYRKNPHEKKSKKQLQKERQSAINAKKK